MEEVSKEDLSPNLLSSQSLTLFYALSAMNKRFAERSAVGALGHVCSARKLFDKSALLDAQSRLRIMAAAENDQT